ncbi:MAG: phage terminase large subunit family protein [bacterium]
MTNVDNQSFVIPRRVDAAVTRALREGLSAAGDEIEERLSRGCAGGNAGRAEWALRNATLDGRPFSFERHECLRGIYECGAAHIVIEKAAQMGGSVFGILDALWALDTGRARRAVYFFPTARDMDDFVRDRVKPFVSGSPRLAARARGADNVHYLQFVNGDGAVDGSLYFRGMKSKVSTASVPADLIMIDERDKVTTADYELAVKRLSHSELALQREACTPTISDYGIDAAFERSDMRFWTLKCERCGTENQPERTFREDNGPDRVLYERGGEVYLGCRKCAARLDAAAGRWAADWPGREIAGFHLSQLYSQVIQRGRPVQAAILDDFRNTRCMADFWNSRVGFPYEDSAASLTAESLNACDGGYPMASRGVSCSMGVDQGNELHAVISDRQQNVRRVVWAGILDRFEGLDALMRNYDVRTCVIDGMPNKHSARDFASRFPGRVYLCRYQRGARGGAMWNDSGGVVAVDRTESLDASAGDYQRGGVRLPRHPLIEDVFKPQMRNAARRPLRDAAGEITGYEWVRRGPDHFRHADSYCRLADTRGARDLGSILAGVGTAGSRTCAPPESGSREPDVQIGTGRDDMKSW